MTLYGALWVELASELPPGISHPAPAPIVWRDGLPISYAAVTNRVGPGFGSAAVALAGQAIVDRCFVAAWRWERAGAHHVLTESAEHTLWQQQLAAVDGALDAIESYSPTLPAWPPLGMTAEDALNFAEATSEDGLNAAEAALLSTPIAPEPPVFEFVEGFGLVRVGGAPQYAIDQGVAFYAGLRRIIAGEPPPRRPTTPGPLDERLGQQRARDDLPDAVRARLADIEIPAEPPTFGPNYGRRVQPNESNDLVLRGRTWGALEVEFGDALTQLQLLLGGGV